MSDPTPHTPPQSGGSAVDAVSVKHTPGPWEIDAYDPTTIYGPSPKGRMRVCDIRGWGHLTGHGQGALALPHDVAMAIQDANARLIAAAPELLEALREVRFAFLLAHAVMGADPAGSASLRLADAAIAKASPPLSEVK